MQQKRVFDWLNTVLKGSQSSNISHQICFQKCSLHLITWDPERLALFRDQIGSDNAKHVRHVRIEFPVAMHVDLDAFTLSVESVHIPEMIKSCFPGPSTLTTSLSIAMELRFNAQDNPKIVTEALKLLNTRFRANSLLQEIIVEVHKDSLSDHIRRETNNHGWKIKDFDRSFREHLPLAPTAKVSTSFTQDAAAERVGDFVAGRCEHDDCEYDTAVTGIATTISLARGHGKAQRWRDNGSGYEMVVTIIAIINKCSGTFKAF